jgi:hypothetical protein
MGTRLTFRLIAIPRPLVATPQDTFRLLIIGS